MILAIMMLNVGVSKAQNSVIGTQIFSQGHPSCARERKKPLRAISAASNVRRPASKNIANDMRKSEISNNATWSVKTGMKWNNVNKTEIGDNAAIQAPVLDQIQHPVTVWAVLDNLDNLGTECQVSSNLGTECQVSSTPAVDRVQFFFNHANMDRTPSQIDAMRRYSMRKPPHPFFA